MVAETEQDRLHVQAYELQMQDYERAYLQAHRLVTRATHFVQGLAHWQTITLAPNTPYVSALVEEGQIALDPSDWPSIQDINATLLAYHEARTQLQTCYDALPIHLHDGVKSPATYIADVDQGAKTR
jgi:hypothetical protein